MIIIKDCKHCKNTDHMVVNQETEYMFEQGPLHKATVFCYGPCYYQHGMYEAEHETLKGAIDKWNSDQEKD